MTGLVWAGITAACLVLIVVLLARDDAAERREWDQWVTGPLVHGTQIPEGPPPKSVDPPGSPAQRPRRRAEGR